MTAFSFIRFSFFLLLCVCYGPVTADRVDSNDGSGGFISTVITEKGLDFIKDLLMKLAVRTLTPLRLHDLDKTVKIPFVGKVHVELSNTTIDHIEVASSTIHPRKSGILIVASGVAANLSTDWYYSSSSTWLVPIGISDKGKASIQVEGMEIGLTMRLENHDGGLKIIMKDCGCSLDDIYITLEGGTSWLYQGLVDAFEEQIKSAVEAAIKRKITKGITKVDSSLQNIPREIRVDENVSLNVSVVDDPLLGNSSIKFDIDGLFFAKNQPLISRNLQNKLSPSIPCNEYSKMLGMSFDEEVFASASMVYFKAGQLHWMVDKVPDQCLLNTACWRFIVPLLYKKYPNDDMQLNVSLTSAPIIRISRRNIVISISSDMIIDVLNENETSSVACISMVITASGVPEILGNNLAGRLALEDFTLSLKWSEVGAFHMILIQGIMRVFLNNVFIPHVNSQLEKGFPVPIIHGFTLKNASIQSYYSRIVICTDIISGHSHGHLSMVAAESVHNYLPSSL